MATINNQFRVPITSANINYAVNSIPSARVTFGVGYDKKGQVATVDDVHGNKIAITEAMKVITYNTIVKLWVYGECFDIEGRLLMYGPSLLFDGYVADEGYAETGNGLEFTITISHWLSKLNISWPDGMTTFAQKRYDYGLLNSIRVNNACYNLVDKVLYYVTQDFFRACEWPFDNEDTLDTDVVTTDSQRAFMKAQYTLAKNLSAGNLVPLDTLDLNTTDDPIVWVKELFLLGQLFDSPMTLLDKWLTLAREFHFYMIPLPGYVGFVAANFNPPNRVYQIINNQAELLVRANTLSKIGGVVLRADKNLKYSGAAAKEKGYMLRDTLPQWAYTTSAVTIIPNDNGGSQTILEKYAMANYNILANKLALAKFIKLVSSERSLMFSSPIRFDIAPGSYIGIVPQSRIAYNQESVVGYATDIRTSIINEVDPSTIKGMDIFYGTVGAVTFVIQPNSPPIARFDVTNVLTGTEKATGRLTNDYHPVVNGESFIGRNLIDLNINYTGRAYPSEASMPVQQSLSGFN